MAKFHLIRSHCWHDSPRFFILSLFRWNISLIFISYLLLIILSIFYFPSFVRLVLCNIHVDLCSCDELGSYLPTYLDMPISLSYYLFIQHRTSSRFFTLPLPSCSIRVYYKIMFLYLRFSYLTKYIVYLCWFSL